MSRTKKVRVPIESSNLLAVRRAVLALPGMSVEQLVTVKGLVESAVRQAKEIADLAEKLVVERIKSTGSFEFNGVRYYAAPNKTTKCVNVREAVEKVLVKGSGDLNVLVECLSAQPLKHGACGQILDAADFNRVFVTEIVDRLKEGKPEVRLQVVDTQFAVKRRLPAGHKGDDGP